MSIFQAVGAARREGVSYVLRKGIDRFKESLDYCKTSLLPRLGVDFWTAYHQWKCRLLFPEASIADPFERRWVDPAEITHVPRTWSFNRMANIGNVRGGTWDRTDNRIDSHPTVKGLRQRFEKGLDWEDTA